VQIGIFRDYELCCFSVFPVVLVPIILIVGFVGEVYKYMILTKSNDKSAPTLRKGWSLHFITGRTLRNKGSKTPSDFF